MADWTNDKLVDSISARSHSYLSGAPRSDNVLKAMREVDRFLFLQGQPPPVAYIDSPFPIGFGQTCSQPSMVAFMLDMLELAPGLRLLEVGAGCGYAAAIASLLCTPTGFVLASEIIPGLAEIAQRNIACWRSYWALVDLPFTGSDIEIVTLDGSAGFPDRAPFDRILLSAGIRKTQFGGFDPYILLNQLTLNGILIYPETDGSLFRIRRTPTGNTTVSWPGVAFVPLIGKNS